MGIWGSYWRCAWATNRAITNERRRHVKLRASDGWLAIAYTPQPRVSHSQKGEEDWEKWLGREVA